MSEFQVYRAIPKADLCNHLGIGMRYASFVTWAGFSIPNFPESVKSTSDLGNELILPFVIPRSCATLNSLIELLSLSIYDAIADGVTYLEGGIDFSAFSICKDDKDMEFVENQLQGKFFEKITFRPELDFGSTVSKEFFEAKAPALLSSGFFKGITVYSFSDLHCFDTLETIFKLAENLGIKRKVEFPASSKAKDIIEITKNYNLNEINSGLDLANDIDAMKYLRDNNIRVNFSPAHDIFFSNISSYAEHPIRKFLDFGINCTINSNGLLIYSKSISEQCQEFVKAGVFSHLEILELLNRNTPKLQAN